jgi:hypothetical protein
MADRSRSSSRKAELGGLAAARRPGLLADHLLIVLNGTLLTGAVLGPVEAGLSLALNLISAAGGC